MNYPISVEEKYGFLLAALITENEAYDRYIELSDTFSAFVYMSSLTHYIAVRLSISCECIVFHVFSFKFSVLRSLGAVIINWHKFCYVYGWFIFCRCASAHNYWPLDGRVSEHEWIYQFLFVTVDFTHALWLGIELSRADRRYRQHEKYSVQSIDSYRSDVFPVYLSCSNASYTFINFPLICFVVTFDTVVLVGNSVLQVIKLCYA